MKGRVRRLHHLERWPAAASCLAGLALMLAACSSSAPPSTAPSPSPVATGAPSRSAPAISVTSTLDGHTSLPHRIQWVATPDPIARIFEVDFLIDGKQMWVEHTSPYSYGDDGNYLVTSFLTAGTHTFTVRAIAFGGSTVVDAVTATVPQAPGPPAALAGTWKADEGPAGTASLVVDAEGWYMGSYPITHQGGNRVDVAYLAPGLVEVRTGMATGHDVHNGASTDDDLNGWCDDAPGSPVRYRWSVRGGLLHFAYVSGDACSGFTEFLTVPWSPVP